MFTIGIFTTHVPYIAMIAFYAFFLFSGVNKANQGEVKIAEQSPTIEMHIDGSLTNFVADNTFGNFHIVGLNNNNYPLLYKLRQKLKHPRTGENVIKKQTDYSLFQRPPPTLLQFS